MLQQSISVNYIIVAATEFCETLRQQTGQTNLAEVSMSPAAVVYDVLKSLSLPDWLIRSALTTAEASELCDDTDTHAIRCQRCGEPAERLVTYRNNELLLCEAHAAQLEARHG